MRKRKYSKFGAVLYCLLKTVICMGIVFILALPGDAVFPFEGTTFEFFLYEGIAILITYGAYKLDCALFDD